MVDSTRELLNLINDGKTINEISEILHLSNKVLYKRLVTLRNAGYDFKRNYYADGNIRYSNGCGNVFYSLERDGVDILVKDKKDYFEALVISDIHFGSVYERVDLLNKVYDYCAREGIHIIIVCGDLLDGTFGYHKLYGADEQLEHLIKDYPFDKNILNFCVLGDHDSSVFRDSGRDISVLLNNYRHDIIPLGYYLGKINVQDDQIMVMHGVKSNYVRNLPGTGPFPQIDYSKYLCLKGHTHQNLKVNKLTNNIIIQIPPFCDISDCDFQFLHGAVRLKVSFNTFVFNRMYLQQLLIGDKVYPINEIEFQLTSCIKNKNRHLNNVLDCKQDIGGVSSTEEDVSLDGEVTVKTLTKEL